MLTEDECQSPVNRVAGTFVSKWGSATKTQNLRSEQEQADGVGVTDEFEEALIERRAVQFLHILNPGLLGLALSMEQNNNLTDANHNKGLAKKIERRTYDRDEGRDVA